MTTKLRITSLGATLLPLAGMAQGQSLFEETMYRSGKINVVVAVVAVILLGIGAWLVAQDRRIGRLERERNEQAE